MSANRPFQFDNDESDDLLIDEDELREVGLTIFTPKEREPRGPRFEYDPELVDRLLAQAGYDATHIPKGLRRAALDVACCLKAGMTDEEEIAEAFERSPSVVRRAIVALNAAGAP